MTNFNKQHCCRSEQIDLGFSNEEQQKLCIDTIDDLHFPQENPLKQDMSYGISNGCTMLSCSGTEMKTDSDCEFYEKTFLETTDLTQSKLNSEGNVENTIMSITTDTIIYSCNVCSSKFKRKYDMLRHMRRSHSSDSSLDKEKLTSNRFCKESSMILPKQERRNKLQVFLNTSEFSTSSLNVETTQTAKANTSCCSICGFNFKRRSDMLRHMRISHAGGKLSLRQQKSTLFCEFCNKGFTRTTSLAAHKEKNHKDMNIIHSTLSCDECGIIFPTKFDLNRHLKEEHQRPLKHFRRNRKEIVASHFCDVCNKGFTRKYDMTKHKKLKHPEIQTSEEMTQRQKNLIILQQNKIPGNGDIDYYKCGSCDKIFARSYLFLRHQTVHTGVRSFSCHICGKDFRLSSGLHRHINDHHRGVKRFSCEVCQQQFSAKISRDNHMNIHTNHRPHICDVCGKAFRHRASLHTHKMFHSNQNLRFTCPVCKKKFRRRGELLAHEWIHTGHRPHKCDECNFSFRLKHDLKRHKDIHNNENKYICTVCGTAFKQQRHLKKHQKIHGVQTDAISNNVIEK